MPLKTSSFRRLMNCRCLLLYFFCFHIRKVIVGAEFTLCGYLHSSINKSRHYIGPGHCSLEVSVNPTGLEIKANLIENASSMCTEDIVANTPNALSEFCITWKEHSGQLFLTHGDVVQLYSTAVDSERKCCQNFVLTNHTSSNDSLLLSDIIYINGTDFSPVQIENASYSEFTGSESVCETSSSDCIKQENKLTQLSARVNLKRNDVRYAILLINNILEDCNQSISGDLESNLSTMMLNMNFSEDSEIFVTPNVKAAAIRNWVGNAEFHVVANFSWVGADGQTMFAAVEVVLEDNNPLFPPPSRRAVVTHFKNKTSIQGQEKIPVSPSVTVQKGNLNIDDFSIPLTVTFQSWRFKSNPIWCQSMASGQDYFDQNGCNFTQDEGTIICSCNRLGYSFNLSLESKVFSFGFSGPFKITAQSNHSNNVNVTPPATGIPCETSLESTNSVSSSADPNKNCNDLFEQWKENDSEQCLDAIKTADMLIKDCHDQIPDIASISSILENKLMFGGCEGETQIGRTENVIFYMKKINPGNFTGLQFPSSDMVDNFTPDLQAEIKLPPTLFNNVNVFNTPTLRVMLLIFKNSILFQDQNKSTILNNVIGIRVGNINFTNLTDAVIIEFNKTSVSKSIQKCVFWDVSQNGKTTTKHWNESGCTTENTDNQAICRCNHLTSFAVLMQLNRNQSLDEKTLISLTYISQIGCGLSAIFTTITLIIHYILRERHKEFSMQIHVNLSAALFLLNVTFLINVWLSSIRTGSFCKVLAVLLHYSLLCSFTWMGIEAFHLYVMLVKVFNTYVKCYMLKLSLVGWGIPAAALFIIVGINVDFYGQQEISVNGNYNSTNHNPHHMCWITNDTVFYVTIIAYFVLVFLGNTSMMTVLCVKVIRLKRGGKKSIFTILGMTCLLGITYGIAFFSYGSQNVPALFLFCILNPLQGFFIFLWYIMLIRSSIKTTGETSKTNRSTIG